MISEHAISGVEYQRLASKIQNEFYKPVSTFKTSIFLCGADINRKDKIRFKISEALTDWWNSYQYDLVFPEDIFDEILYNSKGKDLLSLENLLAESIDVILLIPESPGSYAELGAFANDEKLRSKMICLVDEQYKKDKSFINQGPLKLVKKANKEGIIFIDPNNVTKHIKDIQASIRKIKKISTKSTSKINLLQLDHFLLPSIYLLEPIGKDNLVSFVESVINDSKSAFQVTTTALTIMTKKKFVELTQFGYKLTRLGTNHYFDLKKISSRIKIQDETLALDNLRLEILNLRLRNKKLRI
ncbi:retron St85 family effector protein [Mucilaginibacter sp. AW1-3]